MNASRRFARIVLLGVILAFSFGAVPAYAAPVTARVRGTITYVSDRYGVVGTTIEVGDPFEAIYTHDDTGVDTNPYDWQADYVYSTPPCGMRVTVNGLAFRTDPDACDCLVSVINDGPSPPGVYDSYQMCSWSNLFDLAVPDETDNTIGLYIQDHSGAALSSIALPPLPLNLSLFPATMMELLSWGGPSAGYFIVRGEVTEMEVVVPSVFVDLTTGVTIEFPPGTTSGATTVAPTDPTSPGSPTGFRFVGNGACFDITSTAVLPPGMLATVTIPYSEADVSGQEGNITVQYWDGHWHDIAPITIDTVNNTVTFQTSHLSIYALVEPLSEPVETPASSPWSLALIAALGLGAVLVVRRVRTTA